MTIFGHPMTYDLWWAYEILHPMTYELWCHKYPLLSHHRMKSRLFLKNRFYIWINWKKWKKKTEWESNLRHFPFNVTIEPFSHQHVSMMNTKDIYKKYILIINQPLQKQNYIFVTIVIILYFIDPITTAVSIFVNNRI